MALKKRMKEKRRRRSKKKKRKEKKKSKEKKLCSRQFKSLKLMNYFYFHIS